MLAGKTASPNAARGIFQWPFFNSAVRNGVTLITAPPGYLFSEGLAAAMEEYGRESLWLRLETEDGDPATLLLAIIEAAQHVNPGLGIDTLFKMRSNPGPLGSWPMLFSQLGQELAAGLPATSTIVLEHVHHLANSQPTLNLLCTHLLPQLPNQIPKILISHQSIPTAALPAEAASHNFNELSIDVTSGLELAYLLEANIQKESLRKAIVLLEGRGVPLVGVLSECQILGPTFIERVVDGSKNAIQFLTQISRAALSNANLTEQRTLALALLLNYSHPELVRAVLGEHQSIQGPWIQPLSESWTRIRNTWESSLHSLIRTDKYFSKETLDRAVDYLLQQGDADRAVRISVASRDYQQAARIIANDVENMMDMGRWKTLESWLGQLPPNTLNDWPWLVYCQSELAALKGQIKEARHSFSVAAKIFSAQGEKYGASQSLLAESTLAAWEGDEDRAKSSALKAWAIARGDGLRWQQGWANWQLASLAARMNNLDVAATYVSQASKTVTGQSVSEIFQQMGELLRENIEVQQQRKYHQQKYLEASHEETESSNRLLEFLSSQSKNLPDLLGEFGWMNTPMNLKLSAPTIVEDGQTDSPVSGLWNKLLEALGMHQDHPGFLDLPLDGGELYPEIPINNVPLPEEPAPAIENISRTVIDDQARSKDSGITPVNGGLAGVDMLDLPIFRSKIDTENGDGQTKIQTGEDGVELVFLSAYLLGAFRVVINDIQLSESPSIRGQGVFKYLLIHHNQATSRDILMDVFWPELDPAAARNNLNVAVYSLRQSLRTITPAQVIEFENGNYRIDPNIQLWVDVDEFENHLQAGHDFEAAGQTSLAVREYEIAASLYTSDLLVEDPYEQWSMLYRERLRVAYLDTLDRLSHIYFSQKQYTSCVSICRLILERDDCREDAHCSLMRCYSRMGQRYLALRQYQICVEALRTELDVDPDLSTTQLFEQIRQRQRV